ncbi:pentatricopeptide repeat-containing protein At2g45350, chloroplastic [Glycine soja]|uniref:Pentatricopeptide repeat-containing protein, chloroplastic n=1 Tax=Glycine soja TaxID=3848 RepID=A0A0B2RTP7_GLYSO|nr:pentatricopeptide repeat-containing protein At2g45350, chloroplastic [Glycine soja]KHN35639.1 Pentatricopeptide repeat-containing protein, chloroplastic [Glycine soja]
MLVCATSCSSHQPWASPIPTLTTLPKCTTAEHVNQLHARMITTGFLKNPSLTAKLVLSCISSPREPLVEFARYVFFKHHAFRDFRDDPFLWNALLRSHSHGCDPRGAIVLLCLMIENGVRVDGYSFSLVLKACARVGLVREGMQVYGLLWKMNFGSDVFLQNCLIGLFVRCGCVELARQLFDRMADRDVVSYNSMIDGYVKCGAVERARELFDSMEERNLITWNSMIGGYVRWEEGVEFAWSLFVKMPEKDLVSWNTMIDGCVKNGRMEDARVLFDEMPERDSVSWVTMIDGYVKLGDVLAARRLFDEMPSRDVISCNSMMAGYVQNGCCIEALKIFYDMKRATNVVPDDTTLLIVITAFAQLGHVEDGVVIHHYLMDKGYSLNGKLGVALIDMYSKCGSIDNAISVFENVEQKCVDHWNAMIGGLAIHGMGLMAFDFLMEMGRLSVIPDDITFIGVLSACRHAGMLKEGLICFELMQKVYNLEPKVQHYGCMVDMLSRAGHIEEAKKLIEEMPVEPNDVIWKTLLSACQNYENFSIGEPIAQQLTQLYSCSPSSYVLLSNIYASLGMWDNVKRVRTEMKERQLKKIPGCSWIELGGIVHQFSVQDRTHPQVTEIYSLLSSL